MHLPPAAQTAVGRSQSHLFFLVGWCVVYVGFLVIVGGSIAPTTLTLLASVCLAIWAHAAWRWWRSPMGVLTWTGGEWRWQKAQEKQKCGVHCYLDLQSIVLIELQTQDRQRQWLWVERGAHSAVPWLAFRRALVAGNRELELAGDDETDFSLGHLIPPEQPHMQVKPVAQGAIYPVSGVQNSTER